MSKKIVGVEIETLPITETVEEPAKEVVVTAGQSNSEFISEAELTAMAANFVASSPKQWGKTAALEAMGLKAFKPKKPKMGFDVGKEQDFSAVTIIPPLFAEDFSLVNMHSQADDKLAQVTLTSALQKMADNFAKVKAPPIPTLFPEPKDTPVENEFVADGLENWNTEELIYALVKRGAVSVVSVEAVHGTQPLKAVTVMTKGVFDLSNEDQLNLFKALKEAI